MSRRRKKRASGDVELNLAAMLDMAFQLLTFFILTFKPAPVEGQINLRLPPPMPIKAANAQKDLGSDTSSNELPKGVNTLTISIFSNDGGDLAGLGIGEAGVSSLAALDSKLKVIFSDPSNPFDQVILQVGKKLRYDVLMQVVEVCTRQALPDGHLLSKLSLVELPDGSK
jgi:biopolymer transport protein ExbD